MMKMGEAEIGGITSRGRTRSTSEGVNKKPLTSTLTREGKRTQNYTENGEKAKRRGRGGWWTIKRVEGARETLLCRKKGL